jgi:DNA-binding transcriptional LysR family regulator
MLDVRRLRLLHELARLGTIAAVADALTYTPSAVSQQLAVLEREAGLPLLRRSGRRVVLTAAGERLAEHAGRVLALLERAESELAAARTELTGQLRIGAYPVAVRTLLPSALVALGAEHPGLELMVTELDPVAVPAALRSGALDIALVHEYDYAPSEPDPAVDSEPLLSETIYLATPAAAAVPGAVAAGAGAGPDDPVGGCRDRQWIVSSPDTLCYLMAVRLCHASGFRPRIRHYADDFATVLALVAAGQGVALVPELAAADPPDGVVLTPLPARRHSRIAYRAGAGRHPAVAACANAIKSAVLSLPPAIHDGCDPTGHGAGHPATLSTSA